MLTTLSILAISLIVYSYICLPVLLTVIAKLRTRARTSIDPPVQKEVPKIAIVVAAFNEAGTISHLIRSCLENSYPPSRVHIFVGDDGSSDGTAAEVSSFNDARITVRPYKERRGKISVLNDLMTDLSFRDFGASIVYFCDAKSRLSLNLLQDVSTYFNDPKVGCVACKLTMESAEGKAEGEGLYWKYEMRLKEMEDALGTVMGCNGGGFAMRTELYEAIPAGTIVEDFVISLKALIKGYSIRFCKSAEVRQPACADVKAEWIRKIRIGAGNFQSIRLCAPLLNPLMGLPSLVFWGHKLLRWLTPFLLLLSWLLSAATLIHPHQGDGFAVLNLALGAFLMLSAWLCWGLPTKSWPAPIRLGGYFALMNLALAAGFFRWVFRTQKVTWERADRAWSAPAHEVA